MALETKRGVMATKEFWAENPVTINDCEVNLFRLTSKNGWTSIGFLVSEDIAFVPVNIPTESPKLKKIIEANSNGEKQILGLMSKTYKELGINRNANHEDIVVWDCPRFGGLGICLEWKGTKGTKVEFLDRITEVFKELEVEPIIYF